MPAMALRAVFRGDPDELLRGYEEATDANVTTHPSRPLNHVCVRLPDGFMVVDVWSSEEALREFTEGTLQRSIAATDLPAPETFEVHPVHQLGWPEEAGRYGETAAAAR